MLMSQYQLFEEAFTQRTHDELWQMAADALDAGATHHQLLNVLEALRAKARVEGREADEDRVMDLMDCLVGWCGPHASLVSRGR